MAVSGGLLLTRNLTPAMNRRSKRVTVLVAVLTVFVTGVAAILGRDAVHEWWLLNALQDEDAAERARAARALAELGSLRALPILLPHIDSEDDPAEVCEAAARKICERRGREAIPALVQGLRSVDSGVRFFCVGRLEELGPDAVAAIPALVRALGDEYEWVRAIAVMTLRSMGPAARESSDSLLIVLHDKDVDVAFLAASALLHIDPGCKAARFAMVKFLSDEDQDTREGADRELREHSLLPEITEWLDLVGHEDPQVRRSAAVVLGALPPDTEGALTALAKLIGDENHLVVEAALAGLDRFERRDGATIRAVTALLRRDDTHLAAIGFLARGTAASPEALAAVREGLREGSRTTEFLDQLGEAPPETLSSELIPQLLGFCRAGSDPERRIAAIGVLGNMGPAARSAVPAIEAILEKEEDLEFESWALSALESIEK